MSLFRVNRFGLLSRSRRRKSVVTEPLESRTLLTTFFVDADFTGVGDGSEQAPFNSIRLGVDAALQNPGDDTVVIQPRANRIYPAATAITPGYSPQQIRGFDVFNGDLTIRGGGDSPGDVVIDTGFGHGFYVDAPINVTIENLTINGSGGAGIQNRSSSTVTVDGVHITNHPNNSGITHFGQNLIVRDTVLENNYQGLWSGSGNTNLVPGHLSVDGLATSGNRFHGVVVANSTGVLVLENVTATDNGFAGIRVNNSESLTIDGASVSGNGRNGIVSNLVQQTIISSSTVENNGTTDFRYTPGGGGIHVRPGSAIPVQISDSIVRDNQNWGNGGGIEIWAPQGDFVADAVITNTLVENNVLGVSTFPNIGGGIAINGTANLTLTDSVVAGNTARVGGGVYFGNQYFRNGSPISLTIEGSTVSGNTAWNGGGGVHQFNGTTTITASTFSENVGNSGALQLLTNGGALTNVTVSGNRGLRGGIGVTARNELLVSNSTVTGNVGSRFGGVFSQTSNATFVNTIVADNGINPFLDEVIDLPATSADDLSGAITSLGHNIFGEAEGVTIISDLATRTNPHSTDQFGTVASPLDPVLGPLQDNGGSTMTHLPLDGSPAIDAGDAIASPAADQRGVSRPQRSGVEIGAVEIENNAPTVSASSASVSVNEGITATQSGTFGDIDGDIISLSASTGTVTLNADGTWSWTLATDDGPEDGELVTITATDQFGATATVDFTLVVNNVAPTAAVSGPYSATNEDTVELTLSATDPSSADTAAGFTYDIDWDSDGVIDETVIGAATTVVTHSFDQAGTQTVTVTATDKDGGLSVPAVYTVDVIQAVSLTSKSGLNLNGAKKGNKPFEVVIQSTSDFDASLVDVSSVIWAGAGAFSSTLRDVDGDGDQDLVLKFRLKDTDLIDRYRDALIVNPSDTVQTLDVDLTGETTDGIRISGATTLDLVMTGRSLRDLLRSI